MNAQNLIHKGLLRRITGFRPQQAPVARKNLRAIDPMTESFLNTVPQSVFLTELKQAGEEKICDITARIELHRQIQIAQKFADVYVLLRELDLEYPRHEALYPDAAKDGWLGLLVNRARVLRDEIDEIAHAHRN